MQYRFLGKTGLKVSLLGLGTMGFGSDSDEKSSEDILAMSLDNGINLVDTANIYNQGRSEEILGKFLAGRRQNVILCSKAYFRNGEGANDVGLSRTHILKSVDESLRRLKTDYLDIFYVHHFDNKTDLADLAITLDYLVRSGKAREIGVSNFAAWQMVKLREIQSGMGLAKCNVWQPMYNYIKRQAESEIFECAQSEKIGIITYSPLASGLLTGKYFSSENPLDLKISDINCRINTNSRYSNRYGSERDKYLASQFVLYCRNNNLNALETALFWSTSHNAVSSSLIGARNCDQLAKIFNFLKFTPHENLRQNLIDLSGFQISATDRIEELIQTDPHLR